MKLKVLSLVTAVAIILGVFYAAGVKNEALAAEKTEFSLSVKSETDEEIELEFDLISGGFSAIDIQFSTSVNIKNCLKLTLSDEAKAERDRIEQSGELFSNSVYAVTRKASISTTVLYQTKGALITAVFEKASAAPVNAQDIVAKVGACAVITEPGKFSEVETSVRSELPELAGSCGDKLYYVFDKDSGALRIYGDGMMTDYASASAVPWSKAAKDILSVDISGAQNVGNYAFSGLKAMKSVTLADSVASIGASAFADCIGLESVNLGKVGSIRESAFKNCAALGSVEFSESLSTIPESAFENCASLGRIDIGRNVTTIGNRAFTGCRKLVIGCYIGSDAYDYALKNNIDYVWLDDMIIDDVNSDKSINSSDALFVLQCSVGQETPDTIQTICGDVNADGTINSIDALIILQISVGQIDASEYQREK